MATTFQHGQQQIQDVNDHTHAWHQLTYQSYEKTTSKDYEVQTAIPPYRIQRLGVVVLHSFVGTTPMTYLRACQQVFEHDAGLLLEERALKKGNIPHLGYYVQITFIVDLKVLKLNSSHAIAKFKAQVQDRLVHAKLVTPVHFCNHKDIIERFLWKHFKPVEESLEGHYRTLLKNRHKFAQQRTVKGSYEPTHALSQTATQAAFKQVENADARRSDMVLEQLDDGSAQQQHLKYANASNLLQQSTTLYFVPPVFNEEYENQY